MDAASIEDVFYKEVDTIYLNFSDPWPKNRHEHRRLSSEVFLKRYDSLFKSDKKIIMKTDNRKLFEFSIISFTDYNYKIEEISLDLYNDDIKDNVATEYEKKFVSKGVFINRLVATKNDVKSEM
jgi:tRNA (guanine-N7-)-methyltransferase